ncbi:DUF4910 domain-containing protein [Candidatus Bathyarchaeota archaeon]|nr:DUF4910 domain-containing protein [Candidatus Bathyarchaeota archaeon]
MSAFNFVSEITRYHRIQASPGIRSAANQTLTRLGDFGLKTELSEYPADENIFFWSNQMFPEWVCRDAELRLIEPKDEARCLARWMESKFSVIQRSHPTPNECCRAEVIILENGEEEADYEGLDVEGKMVITNGDVMRVHELAVERRNAIGIIFDGMRTFPPVRKEGDIDDALQYTSFWWTGSERPCFGFVLSPRTGRWLRSLVKKVNKKDGFVKVWAKIDSSFKKGNIENASASILGEADEEVLVVAHICHPEHSANDNASGVGAAMEAARALQRLIDTGSLRKPKRTIKFLFVPEMTGTYAWLSENEYRIPKVIAALNLDMVGENQNLCGSSLNIEKTPESTQSFVNVLLEKILEEVKGEAKNLAGTSSYPLFRSSVTLFSGGSDHYILSDPSVGIPCPMLNQWPDKFYHTSFDTIDKVDPEMLKRVALITATYAYFIADMGLEEASWLMSEAALHYKREVLSSTERFSSEVLRKAEVSSDPSEKLAEALSLLEKKEKYFSKRGLELIKSFEKVGGDNPIFKKFEERLMEDLNEAISKSIRLAEETLANYALLRNMPLKPKKIQEPSLLDREAEKMIPVRLYRGPPATRYWLNRLDEKDRESSWKMRKDYGQDQVLSTLALYWTDGKRNLLEISELVNLEAGRTNLEYLMKYFKLLEKMGLIKTRTESVLER